MSTYERRHGQAHALWYNSVFELALHWVRIYTS